MVEYSSQIQRLINEGWTIEGYNLVKIEKRSLSETKTLFVQRYGNRPFTIYNEEGKSPRTAYGRYIKLGHLEDYPGSILAYDKHGNPKTVLVGKAVSLREAFGKELMDTSTHIMIENKLIEITKEEDRVDLSKIRNVVEHGTIDVTIYYYKILAKEKPLYLKFIYVYTFVSTNVKNPNRRMIEVHFETTIKYSEWNAFKEKTGALEYGRVSDIIESWVTKWDYEFIYQYTNEAEEVLGTPIEAVTEVEIRLKPKKFRSDAHIYDLDVNATIRRSIKTLPDEYWTMENSDIAAYVLTGEE